MLPIIITALAGVLTLAAFFFKVPIVTSVGNEIGRYAVIIAAFAVGIGVINNFIYQANKVIKKGEDWPLNLWFIVAFFLTTIIGLTMGLKSNPYQWIYLNVLLPLGATVVCLMGFYNLQAAFYAYRIRNVDSAIMLICSVIVFMYNVPLGVLISPHWPSLGLWIIQVWQGMGVRVYHMVGAVGTVAIGIRILFMGYATRGVGVDAIKRSSEE